MKRIALILIYNLYVSFICAQTNYYLEDKTFNEDGYTYQADVIGIMVQLYNQDNQWVGRSPKYKVDGSPFFQPEYGYIESYDEESWLDSEKKMSTIANSTLTSMEKDLDYEKLINNTNKVMSMEERLKYLINFLNKQETGLSIMFKEYNGLDWEEWEGKKIETDVELQKDILTNIECN